MRAIVFLALAGAMVTVGSVAARTADTLASADAGLSDVDMVRVCEAASNFAGKRALTPEAAARNAPESVYLTFAPEADKSQQTAQCRVEGDTVAWHVVEGESPAGVLPAPEAAAAVMSFTLKADTVEIRA